MSDRDKYLKKILNLLKNQLPELINHSETLGTSAKTEELIKKSLIKLLPPSFGVGSGMVVNLEGKTSKPINIIIYRKYRKDTSQDLHQPIETYPLRYVLFTIVVNLTYKEDTLTEALDKIKSVKKLKITQIPEQLDNKKHNRINSNLPYCIIGFYNKRNEQLSLDIESFFCSLKSKIDQCQASQKPDYLFSVSHSAYYINPLLSGESASDYDMGLSIEPELNKPKRCHICHKKFTHQHFFYSRLCLKCGDLNYTKRKQKANLEGLTALVTGARVKIGYEVGLKLLRDGASVIATTRFPHDAARRYSQEPDFEQWCDRLHIYGVDFRHIPSVEHFIKHLNTVYTRLDILINNAAQTIRRPSAFYAHLMAFESLHISELSNKIQPLLKHFIPTTEPMLATTVAAFNPVPKLAIEASDNSAIQGSALGINLSAALSQMPLLPEDKQHDPNLFPLDIYAADGQQIDKRTNNSWNLKLDEVFTTELLEVYLINAVVPFMLCSKLKSLMMQSLSNCKYIINVASMEGNFNYISKNSCHPHTNMAKAALNMMTRTSAKDYAQNSIFMNSVDPGWISNENPYSVAMEMEAQGFKPPLDAQDAAARICDPIYEEMKSGKKQYGKLLKNYLPSDW